MQNVIIYCRVSTKEQAENGLSLITQQKMCEEFASKNNLHIVTNPFIEQGESAKTLDRTKLKEMLEFVASNKGNVDTLLIYKIDRLSRQTLDYQSIKVLLAKYGVSIHSLSENIEDSPSGRMLETIMAASAQWDNEVRGERARNGTMEALKQGRWVYAAPYGYIQTGGRGKANLITDRETAPIVKKIFQYLSEGGHTIEDARRYAFGLGLKDNNGKMYNKASFHRLVRRPLYKGFINIPNMNLYIRGTFEPIVEPKVFDIVQDIIDGKNHNPPVYRKIHPDFPLRGTILCPKCNRKMTANWSRKKYPYYKCCYCKNVNLRKADVHNAFQEYLEKIKLSDTLLELTKYAIELNWEERNKAYESNLKELRKRQEQISKEENSIAEQNRQGILPPRVTKELLDKLEEEYAQIGYELSQHKPTEEVDKDLLKYATYFLENICSVWKELEPTSQNELQKFLFSDGLQFNGEKFATNQKTTLEEIRGYITIGKVSENESPGTRTQHLLLKRQLL
ncbi:MAG: site-specific recombinase [candidate division WS6 bacterium GW2011_GWC1_33_20]|uniref:Site-specific recombinase n=1 Tax=candidate division WS6 bacterium GW2011_GWC1_33_20 TaxID=1619089 RepID=A0A0F9ZGA5_9BACT|nr:MAG: site-specific recombinase [candidate division WS6 bacterium GW2011_GWC1_33_20]KKP43304.1 MAG: site-specific recombinase [candidate division WS6 bacterium GW2011_GWE2_33_157]KKP45773.1 MAG: site-specific recombinase [candidate division WS6 bacterium GW2011_GWF1_33_233]KKP55216.1 MAG: site-specific recombinase [candidate division WS6 bacterium GW2011_WS6_33_547]KKP57099.1 MAG: Site-specific recombinase [candidate division WS6 bacterium GW2011_GWF2_33_92]